MQEWRVECLSSHSNGGFQLPEASWLLIFRQGHHVLRIIAALRPDSNQNGRQKVTKIK